MQLRRALLSLLATGLALLQMASAFGVTVDQVTCARMLLTVDLTAAEYQDAYAVFVLINGEQVSEFTLSGSYSPTVLSADFYAFFFGGLEPTTGTIPVEFQLVDSSEKPLTGTDPITQDITFECGTSLSPTSSAGSASPTSSGRRPSGSGSGSGSNGSGSSSSGSSNTGAIAGGVVGGVVAITAITALIFFCMRKRRREERLCALIGQQDVDESGSRGANDSTASLATAPEPENANTPMMRDISTRNVFADPPAGPSTSNNSGGGAAAASAVAASGAAAAGGLGAAAIATRRSRSRSPSPAPSRPSASSKIASSKSIGDKSQPMPSFSNSRGPAPALADKPEAATNAPTPASTQGKPTAPVITSANVAPAAVAAETNRSDAASSPITSPEAEGSSSDEPSSSAAAGVGAGAGATAAATAAAAAGSTSPKSRKWAFKRSSQDVKAKSPSVTPSDMRSLASSAPSQKSAEGTESPARSFKVIQKPQSPELPASGTRSGYATPSSASLRNNNFPGGPSAASFSPGFVEAPAMPPQPDSGDGATETTPTSEFGGNMAGVGAGRAFFGAQFAGGPAGPGAMGGSTSSANSTKWHQQHYNVIPNFHTTRPLARSSQLEEDLIFGNLGMGLSPGPGLAGNGSEVGSARSKGSRQDPFGDR